MASNPFGITQVDIPGLIGMHQQLRAQRLEELYRAKKIEQQDREFQREERKAGVIAKLFGREGGNAQAPHQDMGGQPQATEAATVGAPTTLAPDDAGKIMREAVASKTMTPEQAAAISGTLGPNGNAAFEKWTADNGITVGAAQLPPPPRRDDGIQLNPDALKELFAIDPEMAMKFQDAAGKMDKANLEKIAQHGEFKAKAAMYLLQHKAGPDRQAALQRIVPDLLAGGFTQQEINSAILTDEQLTKDRVMGMGLKDLVSQENTDRTFAATQAERAADNARADRADNRAARADQRSEVRFKERDLDRKALAASGGVRTDISDLNY